MSDRPHARRGAGSKRDGGVAEWERQTISARTKAALAVKKAQGVHCGRKPEIDESTREYIRALSRSGCSATNIALSLTALGYKTARGGQWRESTIRRVLEAA